MNGGAERLAIFLKSHFADVHGHLFKELLFHEPVVRIEYPLFANRYPN